MSQSFSTERIAIQSLIRKSDDLLHHLSIGTKNDNKGVTLMHFDDVMLGLARERSSEASQRAEQLLLALEENYDRMLSDPQYSTALIPNTISFNHVLQAYAHSNGGTKAAVKCENILNRMIARCRQNYEESSDLDVQLHPEPLVSTFNTCMHAWAKSGDPKSGMNAERIFRKMERWNYDVQNGTTSDHSRYKGVHPNARSLAIVIDSWANSNHEQTYDRILSIIYHAVDKFSGIDGSGERDDETNFSPAPIPLNTVVFNSVLNGLANSGRGIEAASKAQEMFSIMEEFSTNGLLQKCLDDNEEDIKETKPNTTTGTLLIKCWTNAVNPSSDDGGKHAASQAEAILKKMEDMVGPRPNALTFTSCMNAWSKCSTESSAKRALAVLERMDRLYEESGDKEFMPNVTHYNTCLSAFSKLKSKDAVKDAKELFLKMQSKELIDTVSYNTMMKIYAEKSSKSYDQIESLYQQMQTEAIYPDTITFNTMMHSLGKSGRADATTKVVEALDHMINLAKEDPHFTPSVESFTVALNTIAQSQIVEKVEPARKLFHGLLSMHEARSDDKMKPDVRIFAGFISTCANQGGDSERKRFALKLALGTYEQLNKKPTYGKPNSFIYGALMKACGRLASDQNEKSRLMEHIFQKCIEDGQLSKITFNKFLKGAPRTVKERTLGRLPNKRLPFEWFRNVKVHERP